MGSRFFLGQIAVLALGLVVLNVAGNLYLHHDPSRTLIREIRAAAPPVDDLFAGNSLVAAGIDLSAYREGAGARRALNIALGGSSPVEHDLLLRAAARLRARRVFYGFFDTQLTEPIPAGFADLAGNRALDHYLDRETAIRLLAPTDAWTAWRIRLVSRLPLVVDRQTLWMRVERLRRTLGDIGMGPAAETNRFGRAADFDLLEAQHDGDFARECRAAADRHAPFSRPVSDLIAFAKANGMRFVIVEMPMRAAHRSRFYTRPEWAAYVDDLRAHARAAGADFLDASDWIADDGFGDALHLDAKGAAEFSRRLGTAQADFPAPF